MPVGENKKVVSFKVPGGQCFFARNVYGAILHALADGKSLERKRERERENAEGGAAEGGVGKGERSGWDGGRFLLARKILGGAFASQCNLPKHFLDNTRFPFPAVAILRKPNASH